MKCLLRFTFFVLLYLVLEPHAVAQVMPMSWQVDGVQRDALVSFPDSPSGPTKHALIFAFHGHGGNMRVAANGLHFQTLWPEAIVVYPQGLNTPSKIDPLGLRPGWQQVPGQVGDRDLKFFDVMLADLKKKYSVDEKQIFATGFSNGSIFSYLLWAERPKVFAAFGICSGRMMAVPSDSRPAVIIAGQTDPLIPFADQEANMETARKIDQATQNGQSCGSGCTLYPSKVHSPVMTYVHPFGHVYPPWGAQAIVSFFQSPK
jgi:polyhydroxybutyrate depolymerase